MTDENLPANQPPEGQFLLYQTGDGQTRIECRLVSETIWLTQRLMSDLFQVTVATINEHLKNLVNDGEIDANRTIRKFLIVQTEGKREVSRQVDHYSLDAILAVGFRVGTPPSGNANFAWLQHFVFHLSPQGRVGVVLAKGALTSKTSGEGDIRKAMIADGNLIDCIVNLPAKLFLNTQIPLSLIHI